TGAVRTANEKAPTIPRMPEREYTSSGSHRCVGKSAPRPASHPAMMEENPGPGLATTVRAGLRQMSARVDGEMIVLNFGDGVAYRLDVGGARIWEHVQQPRTSAELKAALLEEYEVEPLRCESDLLGLLRELRAL